MKLYYEKSEYSIDGTPAIMTWWNGNGYMEPYGNVTVNLSGYGMMPEEGHIFIPTYKMTDDYYKQIVNDIVEEVICPVQIGYGTGVYAKLKEDWESKVEMVKGE